MRRRLAWAAAGILGFVGLIAAAVVALSPRLTPYVNGPEFRSMLDRQTSKGLHFSGRYGPIRRTGTLSLRADDFAAGEGTKAMRSLEARDITATFNPWGVLLRRWQLDEVHIRSGEVEVQAYTPRPDNRPPKPWYSIFLPDRVYLRAVRCDEANVTAQIERRKVGIYGTRILITPHGRDFEYRADGGELRTAGLLPALAVSGLHLLITKKILQLHEFELTPAGGGDGRIRLTGEVGMGDQRQVAADLEFEDLPLRDWLPAGLRGRVAGRVSGSARWRAADQTLAAGQGDADFAINGGELVDLPLLDYLATATRQGSLRDITLSECSARLRWRASRLEVNDLVVTSRGNFSVRGALVFADGRLSGTLDLGVADRHLDWLPTAREEIFTRTADGLRWTKVRVSGTPQKPENDLGPRLARALRRDPAAAAGLFFRGAGEWLEQTFGEERAR